MRSSVVHSASRSQPAALGKSTAATHPPAPRALGSLAGTVTAMPGRLRQWMVRPAAKLLASSKPAGPAGPPSPYLTTSRGAAPGGRKQGAAAQKKKLALPRSVSDHCAVRDWPPPRGATSIWAPPQRPAAAAFSHGSLRVTNSYGMVQRHGTVQHLRHSTRSPYLTLGALSYVATAGAAWTTALSRHRPGGPPPPLEAPPNSITLPSRPAWKGWTNSDPQPPIHLSMPPGCKAAGASISLPPSSSTSLLLPASTTLLSSPNAPPG